MGRHGAGTARALADYTYGLRRGTILAALANAVLLLVTSAQSRLRVFAA